MISIVTYVKAGVSRRFFANLTQSQSGPAKIILCAPIGNSKFSRADIPLTNTALVRKSIRSERHNYVRYPPPPRRTIGVQLPRNRYYGKLSGRGPRSALRFSAARSYRCARRARSAPKSARGRLRRPVLLLLLSLLPRGPRVRGVVGGGEWGEAIACRG